MTPWTPKDIDRAFTVEFSVNGVVLSGSLSTEQRRERIRIELLRERREDLPFHDSGMSYAEAYQLRFGQSIERRAVPRDDLGRPPSTGVEEDLEDDDDNADIT